MGLLEARETDGGGEAMFGASVSELVSDTAEDLLFVLCVLGGDARCLLKDAKADVGLQPACNSHKTVNMNDRNTFPTMVIFSTDDHLLTVPLNQPQI